MKLAVCFDNLGPYHLARLKDLAKHCDLAAVQYRTRSIDYGWEVSTRDLPYVFTVLNGTLTGSSAAAYKRLDIELRYLKPDAIAIPGWATHFSQMLMMWALAYNVPTILMSDSQEIDFPRTRLKEFAKSKLVGLFSTAIVAGTKHREYLTSMGFDPARITLGYDVVDNFYFNSRSKVARGAVSIARRKFNLPESYFLCCARLVEKKNLPFLIGAYSNYLSRTMLSSSRRPTRHLVIVGDGPLRGTLEQMTSSMGVSDFVHFNGHASYADIPTFYALADFFILPSKSEQWGLVVNEAMACELPVVISSHCGCAPDLVRQGINGFTFDPTEERSLSDTLIKMDLDADQLGRMGAESYKIISQWDLDRFSSALLQVAQLATSGPPLGSPLPGRIALRGIDAGRRLRHVLLGNLDRD